METFARREVLSDLLGTLRDSILIETEVLNESALHC